jgi:GT2 family glycosyltransferase
MDPQPSAPPVVAVVVTCDPGPWLEETLEALATQDYPSLSVLVIDAASTDDPTPRVATVLPDAYVHRLPERVGFAVAANDVLTVVEGASHFLFCHDDAAPATDAVRLLVEEAFRSNAGVVCPKLVDWDRPDRLLSVGGSTDKTGIRMELVDSGELDQEQHDAVRDVFVAPGGATLVRADLFIALGGYDPVIDLLGEDLNLSWRAQVAGARVVVNPAARVRHREALAHGQRSGWSGPEVAARTRRLTDEHRLRSVLTCYSLFHLVRVLPQAILITLAQVVVELASRRPAVARATLDAWPAALREPSLRAMRRATQARRTVPDGEIRRLQVRASARLEAAVRRRLDHREDQSHATRPPWTTASIWPLRLGAGAAVLAALLVGSRGLLGGAIPGVGHLPVTSTGPVKWWHLWFGGWRPGGLGSGAPAPTALALLGLSGTLLIGATGLLQRLLVLGPLVLGPLGAYRAARVFPSERGRVAALVVYAVVPLPYNALAAGRWAALVLYAAAPWVMGWLIGNWGRRPQPAGPQPAGPQPAGPQPAGPPPTGWAGASLALGVVVAVTAAFVPAILVLVPLVAVGLVLGSLLTMSLAGVGRSIAVALGSTAVAAILLAPWSIDLLGSRTALFGVPGDPVHAPGLGRLLAFHTGPIGAGWPGWALVVVAALPLVIGRSWRLVWAARCWGVALTAWGVAWAAGRGWLGVPLAAPDVVLTIAAAALALAVALAVAAFEQDLSGFRFGWRQVAASVATVAVVISFVPILVAARGGRWRLPGRGFESALAWVPQQRAGGGFRVLWVGDPNALPMGSWRLVDGVGYATSNSGLPDVSDQWPAGAAGATPLLASDLRLASGGETTRLGHLLAPMAVQYIVVPTRLAPGPRAPTVPVPADLVTALGQQEDLRTVASDEALLVYQNTAWAPSPAVLAGPAQAASRSASPAAAQGVSLAGAPPLLTGGQPDAVTGRVPAGVEVLVASTRSGRWNLSVAGHRATRRGAFGWAMAFAVAGPGGRAVLRYRTPLIRDLALLIQILLWAAAAAHLARRRRLGAGAWPVVSEAAGEEASSGPISSPAAGPLRRPPRLEPEPVVPSGGDDLW